MSSADSHLYGIRKPKTKTHEISSSTSLAFTSTLSSLLATKPPSTTTGRARPSAKKSDIFTAHNKNTKKRALKDVSDDAEGVSKAQVHSTNSPEVSDEVLHRSKRMMEEKARLYAAMKRGDYVAPDGGRAPNHESGPLIDFDRKWAESSAPKCETESDDDDGGDSDSPAPTHAGDDEGKVEYTDEFGRVRLLRRADAARLERKKARAERAARELAELRARPVTTSDLIHGDTIQANAFAPSAATRARMAALAARRDRSATPPAATHYDAAAEVRRTGVGFFAFSADAAPRAREMAALAAARADTRRRRAEREEQKARRAREAAARREVVRARRARKEADRFLEGLAGEMAGAVEAEEEGRVEAATDQHAAGAGEPEERWEEDEERGEA